MSLYKRLQARADRPIGVGVIGAGKFGTMFLSQAARLPGVHIIGVSDLDPGRARENMLRAHWDAARLAATSLDDAAGSGATFIGDDAAALIAHPAVDIVVEATGNPIVAVSHLLAAFEAGKDVVSATVESDAMCGAALAKRAAAAGVVYSMAYGDQPAMTCALVDWARCCGFEVVAAGRGHKWRPEFRFSTPDTIWDNWGLTAEQAARGGLNPKMFNSFLDGTKPAIETCAIANACGLDAPTGGLTYPSGSIDDIPTLMRPTAEGGVLEAEGRVEVINCLDEAGAEIPYDIRMGVFAVVRVQDEYRRNCFEEYKVKTDPSGRYVCAYTRWHLIGLELGLSIAQVGIRREPTGVAAEFRADVPAVAKRDLAPGEILDGEGGYTVAGQLRPARLTTGMGALPLGLTGGARVMRPVARDAILTYDDVALEPSAALDLRREAEALA